MVCLLWDSVIFFSKLGYYFALQYIIGNQIGNAFSFFGINRCKYVNDLYCWNRNVKVEFNVCCMVNGKHD